MATVPSDITFQPTSVIADGRSPMWRSARFKALLFQPTSVIADGRSLSMLMAQANIALFQPTSVIADGRSAVVLTDGHDMPDVSTHVRHC